MDTLAVPRAVERPVAAKSARLGWRWLPFVTAATVTVAGLLATHTAPTDILRYAAYWSWAIVLPGTLVYRSLRGKAHSLVDDVAMGAALGLVLEIAAYILLSLTGSRGFLRFWPILPVLLTLAVPGVRRRVLARGGVRPSLRWSWAVVGVYLFLFGYLTFAFLAPVDVHPATDQKYHIDLIYFLSIIGEARHHFPLQTPSIAGNALSYHWFSYAHLAVGSLISGVDAPTVLFRVGLPPLFALAVVIVSVVGWRVSRRPWVGVGAAALTFVVGEASLGSLAFSAFGGEVGYTLWSSPSVVYGYVIGAAIIGAMVDQFRRDPDTYLKPGRLILLSLFLLAAPGAKSTVLPVTLCAVGLVCLVQLVTRRLTVFPWLAAGLMLAAQLLGMALLYRFQSFGLTVAPLRTVRDLLTLNPSWSPLHTDVAYVIGVAGFLLFWGARLAAAPAALWSRRDRGLTEWFLVGGVVSGFAAALLLHHPSLSQLFILRSGVLFGTILSAMGVAVLVDRLKLTPGTVVALVAGAAAVVVVLWSALYLRYGATGPVPHHHRLGDLLGGYQILRVLLLGVPLLAIALALAAAGVLLGHRLARWRGHLRLGALLIVLTGGLMCLPADAHWYPNVHGGYHQDVSATQQDAAAWIRANTSVDHLLATNEHCVAPPPYAPYNTCLNLSYWLSGWSERRVLLESWGYGTVQLPFGPYPDATFQSMNDGVFSDPTAEGLRWMRDHGVHTLVVDRRYGPVSPSLATFAKLRWQREYLAIYTI